MSAVSDDEMRALMQMGQEAFRDKAPMTAAEAATVILDGVRAEKWRILVGDDAHRLDAMVRQIPEEAYEPSFIDKLRENSVFGFMNDR